MKRCNIRIDLEAYERLRASKLAGESFSDVIKRIVPHDLDRLFDNLGRLSPASQIRRRRNPTTRRR